MGVGGVKGYCLRLLLLHSCCTSCFCCRFSIVVVVVVVDIGVQRTRAQFKSLCVCCENGKKRGGNGRRAGKVRKVSRKMHRSMNTLNGVSKILQEFK